MSSASAYAERTLVPPGVWTVDCDASVVRFSIKHLLVATVRGRFWRVSGTVSADEHGLRAEGTVDVASIDTREAMRDERLRGPGFFDADAHPEIRFRATSARAGGRGGWDVRGDLTIGGRTHPLTFVADVAGTDAAPVIRAQATVSRDAHGLNWPGLLHSGSAVVGDRIALELELVLHRCT